MGSNLREVLVTTLQGREVRSANSGFNPVIDGFEVPSGKQGIPDASTAKAAHARTTRSRGKVTLQRQTAHRGGKTVTVIFGFVGIGLPEKERLAKSIQQACGTGGTVKEGRIEIQGDRRDVASRILSEAGFTPIFAGG